MTHGAAFPECDAAVTHGAAFLECGAAVTPGAPVRGPPGRRPYLLASSLRKAASNPSSDSSNIGTSFRISPIVALP